MSILEVDHVSIRYMTGDFKDIGIKEYILRRIKGNYHVNEFWADQDISFTLEKGDMLGIIGTNGAGKSTLLKAISGIMEPTKGSVKRQGNLAALLELASGFDGELTVRENTYLRGAMLGYTRQFMDEMYNQIIEFAELQNFQDRPFKQLSSGMKSRLAFSIASLVNPDILILDEVLSVGDGAFRKKSENKMREIINGGTTTILVSHSIAQIKALCNKVLWLHKGQQIAFGDTKKICSDYEKFLAGQDSFYINKNYKQSTTALRQKTLPKRKSTVPVIVAVAAAITLGIGGTVWGHFREVNASMAMENIQNEENALLKNASNYLEFNDGSQNLQACHPSVLSFEQPWNGYRYWMAFSPYPGHNDYYENPHIYASNDQLHWEIPDGLINPLESAPPDYEHEKVYNSDPELVFNTDTNRLECWWRFVDDHNDITRLYRRTTEDGIHWSERECMTLTGRKSIDYVSFALLYEDHRYKMWSVAKFQPQYCESEDGKAWSERKAIEIPFANKDLRIWHLDVIHTEKYGYEMVFVAFDKNNDKYKRYMKLYYSHSEDNTTYSAPQCLIAPTGNNSDWDGTGLYRSSLLCDSDGEYSLYYTGINGDSGEDPDTENVGVTFWSEH